MARTAKPAANDDSKALKNILDGFQAVDAAARKLKDEKGECLKKTKEATEELRTAIDEAKAAEGTDDVPHKLRVVTACWDALEDAKKAAKKRIADAKEALETAQIALGTALANSRQAELGFEGEPAPK